MEQNNDGLDSGLLLIGFILGLIVGGITALFKAPRSGGEIRQQISENIENSRSKLESVVTTDPLAESLEEGKAAARRRRSELGLS
jgi:gas vesicle protein